MLSYEIDTSKGIPLNDYVRCSECGIFLKVIVFLSEKIVKLSCVFNLAILGKGEFRWLN